MSIAEKLITIAENEQMVYEAGHTKGFDVGYENGYGVGYEEGKAEGGNTEEAYNDGYEAGQQDEYDRFWDNAQDYGNRENYNFAFSGNCFVQDTFNPKYIIRPINANNMCAYWGEYGVAKGKSFYIDLGDSECFDFSRCENGYNIFLNNSRITRLNVLDFSSHRGTMQGLLSGAINLVSVKKFVFPDNNNTLTGMVQNCVKLKDFIAEGVIGRDVDFSACPLTVASMKSIITHLKDYSGTSSEFTCTIKFSSACWTALNTDSDASSVITTIPTGTTWKEYVQDFLCWNI